MDVSARKNLVSEYLCKLAGQQDLDESINIFETGLVNSLAVIQLISFLEKNFKIKVEIDDLDTANFSSIQAICSFLDKKAAVNA
ncbi:acyl carrier protein [Chromobacterium sphagni]|uniref:Acyl carrier protein n=1 Tax=Chromobacterium sphagni TaxID=1903179 RepID=A0A1S1WWM3_9NEIS|nr:phosphopantetheine-binding protein [Chromobacterium sphagni]OHX11602.1 acyl carrier protein [Chromobacterium sphagni]OHX15563.1 acyl carrier protein [Chromobacterium sphagni]